MCLNPWSFWSSDWFDPCPLFCSLSVSFCSVQMKIGQFVNNNKVCKVSILLSGLFIPQTSLKTWEKPEVKSLILIIQLCILRSKASSYRTHGNLLKVCGANVVCRRLNWSPLSFSIVWSVFLTNSIQCDYQTVVHLCFCLKWNTKCSQTNTMML